MTPSSFQIDLPDTTLARASRGEPAALEAIYRSYPGRHATFLGTVTGATEQRAGMQPNARTIPRSATSVTATRRVVRKTVQFLVAPSLYSHRSRDAA